MRRATRGTTRCTATRRSRAGSIIYALWLVFVLAIAVDRRDLLALRRPRSWKRGARLAIGAIVAIYVLEAVVSFIPLPQSPGNEQGLTPTHWEPAHAGAFAANVVLFTLVAPLVEELTFRGARPVAAARLHRAAGRRSSSSGSRSASRTGSSRRCSSSSRSASRSRGCATARTASTRGWSCTGSSTASRSPRPCSTELR